MAELVPSSIALWKPFTGKGTTPLTHDIVCVHTMVGSLAGSWNWANGAGRSYWHFGTSGLGDCWQCHDLRHRSAANLNGNDRVIPIENADMGPGFAPWNSQCGNVPPFTQAQVDKLIDLIEWLCRRYDIPPELIPDTRQGRRGIAYHRQGINPWRVPDGELWSLADFKCCPDFRRINQLVGTIIPAVAARLAAPVPSPEPLEDDDMIRVIGVQGDGTRPHMAVYDGYVKKFTPTPPPQDEWAPGEVWGNSTEFNSLLAAKVFHPVHFVEAGDYDRTALVAKRVPV